MTLMAAGTPDLVSIIVTGLLTGGIASGITALIVGRANARKTNAEAKGIDARLPAEVDSVVVQGAEAAVLTMKAALDSATARIIQLETDRESDRKTIAALNGRVDELRRKVDTAERAVNAAQEAGTELRAELEALIRDRGGRK